jgi:WD40 repeat protein
MQAHKAKRRTQPTRAPISKKILCVDAWLRQGPLHIQGLRNIVAEYGRELQGTCLHTLEGHTDAVTVLAMWPDGKIASGSYDCTVRVWQNGACLFTLVGHNHLVSDLVGFCFVPFELIKKGIRVCQTPEIPTEELIMSQ